MSAEKRPRRGEEVRVDGRRAKVIRADYAEGTARVFFTDKRGGIKAIELDEFMDNWTGRRWVIESHKDDENDESEERTDMQMYFDWCYCRNEPYYDFESGKNIVKEHQRDGEERLERLKFCASFFDPDDPRLTLLKMAEEGADDPGYP